MVSGSDVVLTWAVNRTENLTAFAVYRGPTQDDLGELVQIDGEARSYVDEDALLTGESVWYAVEAQYLNGTTVRGPPTHVSGVQLSPGA